MDRYVKAVLTVIVGCLVLVGSQLIFAESSCCFIELLRGDNDGGTAVTDDGMVYYDHGQRYNLLLPV